MSVSGIKYIVDQPSPSPIFPTSLVYILSPCTTQISVSPDAGDDRTVLLLYIK